MKNYFIFLFMLLCGCAATITQPHPMGYTHEAPVPEIHQPIFTQASKEMHAIHYPVNIDSRFTPSEFLLLKKAISEWNFALNGFVVFDNPTVISNIWKYDQMELTVRDLNRFGFGLDIIKMDNENYSRYTMNYNTLAITMDNVIVVVGHKIINKNLKIILLHEIGHFLGSEHTDELSLMGNTYSTNPFDCIDYLTIIQVARKYNLYMSELKYCVAPSSYIQLYNKN